MESDTVQIGSTLAPGQNSLQSKRSSSQNPNEHDFLLFPHLFSSYYICSYIHMLILRNAPQKQLSTVPFPKEIFYRKISQSDSTFLQFFRTSCITSFGFSPSSNSTFIFKSMKFTTASFTPGYALRHPPSYLHSLHSPRQFYNSSSSFHSFLSFTIIQLSNRLIVVSILSQLLPRSMGLTESLPNRSNLFPFGQKQFLNFAPLAPCFLDCGLL